MFMFKPAVLLFHLLYLVGVALVVIAAVSIWPSLKSSQWMPMIILALVYIEFMILFIWKWKDRAR
jgi:hypothetical protein